MTPYNFLPALFRFYCWNKQYKNERCSVRDICALPKIPTISFYICKGARVKNVWMSDKSWEPSSLSHSISFYMLNNFCFYGYAEKAHSHTLAHSHSHSSFSHSLSLDMLINFCSKVTGNSRKLQWFFWDLISTLPCYFRCPRAGSQLKIYFFWPLKSINLLFLGWNSTFFGP